MTAASFRRLLLTGVVTGTTSTLYILWSLTGVTAPVFLIGCLPIFLVSAALLGKVNQ